MNLHWYILKTSTNNEDAVAKSIIENVELYNLGKSIKEVKVFKSYEIVETEEYPPSSDLLPAKAFRNTKKSRWLKLPNGNYKKIKIIENKPLNGLIFIKMNHEKRLFHEIVRWVSGIMFLGGSSNPTPTTHEDFSKMDVNYDIPVVPDLDEYLMKNNLTDYVISSNSRIRAPKSVTTEKKSTAESEINLEDFDVVSEAEVEQIFKVKTDEELKWEHYNDNPDSLANLSGDLTEQKGVSEVANNLAESSNVASELPFMKNLSTVIPPVKKPAVLTKADVKKAKKQEKIKSQKVDDDETKAPITFKEGDNVKLKSLETVGVVQAIDHKTRQISVTIQLFGRQQVVSTTPEELEVEPD